MVVASALVAGCAQPVAPPPQIHEFDASVIGSFKDLKNAEAKLKIGAESVASAYKDHALSLRDQLTERYRSAELDLKHAKTEAERNSARQARDQAVQLINRNLADIQAIALAAEALNKSPSDASYKELCTLIESLMHKNANEGFGVDPEHIRVLQLGGVQQMIESPGAIQVIMPPGISFRDIHIGTASSTDVEKQLNDAEGAIEASIARIGFISVEPVEPEVIGAVEAVRNLEPTAGSDPRYEHLQILAQVLCYFIDKKPAWSKDAIVKLSELKKEPNLKPRLRMLAASLMGIALTFENPERYSAEAEQEFREAVELSKERGTCPGAVLNGLGMQLNYHADDLAADGSFDKASWKLEEAKKRYADQRRLDNSPLSYYKYRNNTNYADCSYLLWIVRHGWQPKPNEIPDGSMAQYFQRMEADLVDAERHAYPKAEDAAFTTSAEYWSLKGEYYQLNDDAIAAEGCFETCMDKLEEAIVKYEFCNKRWQSAPEEAKRGVQAIDRWRGVLDVSEHARQIEDWIDTAYGVKPHNGNHG
jgi:hypothetical protein